MSSFMQTLFWGLIRYVLRLRYRVQVIGAEQLRTVTGPTLVIRGIRTATITGRLLGSHSRLASVTPSRRETSDGYELGHCFAPQARRTWIMANREGQERPRSSFYALV